MPVKQVLKHHLEYSRQRITYLKDFDLSDQEQLVHVVIRRSTFESDTDVSISELRDAVGSAAFLTTQYYGKQLPRNLFKVWVVDDEEYRNYYHAQTNGLEDKLLPEQATCVLVYGKTLVPQSFYTGIGSYVSLIPTSLSNKANAILAAHIASCTHHAFGVNDYLERQSRNEK